MMGLHQEEPKEDTPPVRKYRYSIKRDTSNGKLYMVGLVLREHGGVEVYSDFMKVSEYFNPINPCVDIETTTTDFFQKCIDSQRVLAKKMDDAKISSDKDIFVYLKIDHRWRNRIDVSTATEFFEDSKWDRILHRRVA